MSIAESLHLNRRSMLKSSLALLAGGAVGQVADAEPEIKNVNTASSPSSLKITDMAMPSSSSRDRALAC
jgi:hypothetical protein